MPVAALAKLSAVADAARGGPHGAGVDALEGTGPNCFGTEGTDGAQLAAF
jgi:hypothetical protein